MQTDDIKARADRFGAALNRVFREFRFQAGQFATFRSEDVSVVVCPLETVHGNSAMCDHLLTITRGLIPPPEVQELPCGIVGPTGIIWAGETDRRGQFRVTLPPGGNCQLRCVLGVTDEIDVAILARLNSPSLNPILEDALDDPDVPVAIKNQIARVHGQPTYVVPPPTTPVTWTIPVTFGALVEFADDEAGDELPANHEVGLTRDGRWFRIRVPVDNAAGVTFAYALALVEYVTGGGHTLTRRLVPVDRDEQSGCYVGRLEAKSIYPREAEGEPGRFHCTELSPRRPDVLRRVSLAEVDELLQTPYVKYSSELRRRVLDLRKKLKEMADGSDPTLS